MAIEIFNNVFLSKRVIYHLFYTSIFSKSRESPVREKLEEPVSLVSCSTRRFVGQEIRGIRALIALKLNSSRGSWSLWKSGIKLDVKVSRKIWSNNLYININRYDTAKWIIWWNFTWCLKASLLSTEHLFLQYHGGDNLELTGLSYSCGGSSCSPSMAESCHVNPIYGLLLYIYAIVTDTIISLHLISNLLFYNC